MIKLNKVSKTYRTDKVETLALKDVDLHVQKGEFLAMMGPSGCGKSTLLNLIGLLDRPGQGSIEVEGLPVTRYKDKQVARLRNQTFGFIFQSFHLIPDLRVIDNVELPLLYRSMNAGERRRLAREALEKVSLGEFIDRFTRVVKIPAPELRPSSLKAMVDDILWLNREQCARSGIRLGWRRCDEVAPVLLDAGLMEGALLNIVKNAIEAVMEKGAVGGHVELALEKDGGDTVLAVIDSADLLGAVAPRQLFTPFFSTKQGGQGIGLMFVREVLTRHGLAYSLASTGQGETRFEIRF